VRSAARDALQAHLAHNGVETLIHYPIPLHEQPPLAPYAPGPCQESRRAGRELLSLPNHPRLTDADATRVAGAVAAFERGRVRA
jgi:dTDP-4-amino-4,6-dideoxygalactose transaminase